MQTVESYQDDLDLLVDRAEAAVASILIMVLAPDVANGSKTLTASGFSVFSAVKKLSESTKASKLTESLVTTMLPAVIGAVNIVKDNKYVDNVYEIAKSAVDDVVDKAVSYYDSKELDSATSLADSAKKTSRWMVRSAAFSAQETAAKSVMLKKKRWVTRHDDRVRASHMSLDGQTVPIDKKFKSQSGASLMFPGDITAPLSEVINCRCSVEFV